MTHPEALSQALSMARQYYSQCIIAAQKAEAIGDYASRDKELDDAERKASEMQWYQSRLDLMAVPLTYPQIMEAAE